MSTVALVSDLMIQSQLLAAASRASVQVDIANSLAAMADRSAATPPRLMILDLSHPGLDPGEAIGRLKPLLAPGGKLVAFGPHVHKARLEDAAAAGADVVMSRGEFHATMDEILGRHGR